MTLLPRNAVVRFFGVVLLIGLALWAFTAIKGWGWRSPFEQQAERAAAKTEAAVVVVAKMDSLRAPLLVDYTVVRNRTRSIPAADEVGRAADKVIKADSNAITARDSAFKAQKEELQIWKDKKPPRLAAYVEGLYDLAHMVPVVRIGATFKVLGPFSLSAAGQYAAPQVGLSKPDFRVLVGARYDF